ncbi:MAG: pantetheine-phosphate adenylyltransferase [Luteibaculaceae bacterium]
MSKIALFPGSFDPITKGHEELVLRAVDLFDKIVIGVGENTAKSYLFDKEKRLFFVKETFKSHPKIEVEPYTGLTVDFCEKIGARYLLRGLRNSLDFEYEKTIAQMNRALNKKIETVLLYTDPEVAAVSSTTLRDIVRAGRSIADFVPKTIVSYVP